MFILFFLTFFLTFINAQENDIIDDSSFDNDSSFDDDLDFKEPSCGTNCEIGEVDSEGTLTLTISGDVEMIFSDLTKEQKGATKVVITGKKGSKLIEFDTYEFKDFTSLELIDIQVDVEKAEGCTKPTELVALKTIKVLCESQLTTICEIPVTKEEKCFTTECGEGCSMKLEQTTLKITISGEVELKFDKIENLHNFITATTIEIIGQADTESKLVNFDLAQFTEFTSLTTIDIQVDVEEAKSCSQPTELGKLTTINAPCSYLPSTICGITVTKPTDCLPVCGKGCTMSMETSPLTLTISGDVELNFVYLKEEEKSATEIVIIGEAETESKLVRFDLAQFTEFTSLRTIDIQVDVEEADSCSKPEELTALTTIKATCDYLHLNLCNILVTKPADCIPTCGERCTMSMETSPLTLTISGDVQLHFVYLTQEEYEATEIIITGEKGSKLVNFDLAQFKVFTLLRTIDIQVDVEEAESCTKPDVLTALATINTPCSYLPSTICSFTVTRTETCSPVCGKGCSMSYNTETTTLTLTLTISGEVELEFGHLTEEKSATTIVIISEPDTESKLVNFDLAQFKVFTLLRTIDIQVDVEEAESCTKPDELTALATINAPCSYLPSTICSFTVTKPTDCLPVCGKGCTMSIETSPLTLTISGDVELHFVYLKEEQKGATEIVIIGQADTESKLINFNLDQFIEFTSLESIYIQVNVEEATDCTNPNSLTIKVPCESTIEEVCGFTNVKDHCPKPSCGENCQITSLVDGTLTLTVSEIVELTLSDLTEGQKGATKVVITGSGSLTGFTLDQFTEFSQLTTIEIQVGVVEAQGCSKPDELDDLTIKVPCESQLITICSVTVTKEGCEQPTPDPSCGEGCLMTYDSETTTLTVTIPKSEFTLTFSNLREEQKLATKVVIIGEEESKLVNFNLAGFQEFTSLTTIDIQVGVVEAQGCTKPDELDDLTTIKVPCESELTTICGVTVTKEGCEGGDVEEPSEEPTDNLIESKGKCGEQCEFGINEDILCIWGSGKMYDFTTENLPGWKTLELVVKSIKFFKDQPTKNSLKQSGNSGITTIGTNAFSEMNDITEISIPETVTDIKEGAFKGCSKLEKVIISEGVKTIEKEAFGSCSSLKEINLPKTIETINAEAFKESNSIEKVKYEGTADVCGEDKVFGENVKVTVSKDYKGETFCGSKNIVNENKPKDEGDKKLIIIIAVVVVVVVIVILVVIIAIIIFVKYSKEHSKGDDELFEMDEIDEENDVKQVYDSTDSESGSSESGSESTSGSSESGSSESGSGSTSGSSESGSSTSGSTSSEKDEEQPEEDEEEEEESDEEESSSESSSE